MNQLQVYNVINNNSITIVHIPLKTIQIEMHEVLLIARTTGTEEVTGFAPINASGRTLRVLKIYFVKPLTILV